MLFRSVTGDEEPGRRIFEVGRVDRLTAVLDRVLDHLDAEFEGAEALAAEILDRFSWDEAARRTVEVYESVLNGQ